MLDARKLDLENFELASYDSNGDGKISVADIMWADLKIWRDYDQDGVTDSGDSVTGAGRELFTLAQLGIVELSLTNPALNVTTPTGAQLLSSGDVTFTSGRVTKMFEAIFQSSDVDTRFNGEAGVAPWANSALNVKGFGSITDLSAATPFWYANTSNIRHQTQRHSVN
jgi:hypothetical protein